GKRDDLVTFDYTPAFSSLIPWPVDDSDICNKDPDGRLFEFPIYCENRPIWIFITPNRVIRVIQGFMHPLAKSIVASSKQDTSPKQPRLIKYFSMLTSGLAWKMDFNQCTGNQLINGLKRIEIKYEHMGCDLPVVLIGHSKIFTSINEKSLIPFIEYRAKINNKYCFAT